MNTSAVSSACPPKGGDDSTGLPPVNGFFSSGICFALVPEFNHQVLVPEFSQSAPAAIERRFASLMLSNSDQTSEPEWLTLWCMAQNLKRCTGSKTLHAGDAGVETPGGMRSVFLLLPAPGRPPMKIEALRLLIREKLEDGCLPHEQISRVHSCPADGEKCGACERRITTAQLVVTGFYEGARCHPVSRDSLARG